MTKHEKTLEEIILEDVQGSMVMKINDDLELAIGEYKKELNRGLSQDEADSCRLYIQSLTSARQVVEKIWSSQHSILRRSL